MATKSNLVNYKSISKPSYGGGGSSRLSTYITSLTKKQNAAEDAILDNQYEEGIITPENYLNALETRSRRDYLTPLQKVNLQEKMVTVKEKVYDAVIEKNYKLGEITTEQVYAYEKDKLDKMTAIDSPTYNIQAAKVQGLKDKAEKEARTRFRLEENVRISKLPEDSSANLWEKANLYSSLQNQATLDGDTNQAYSYEAAKNNYTASAKKAEIMDSINSVKQENAKLPSEGLGVPSSGSGEQIYNKGQVVGGGEIDPLIKKYFPEDQWNNAQAVMMAESGGRDDAIGDNYPINGETIPSVGRFQIRTLPGRPTAEQLKDPEFNIKYAAEMYKTQGWQPWTKAHELGIVGGGQVQAGGTTQAPTSVASSIGAGAGVSSSELNNAYESLDRGEKTLKRLDNQGYQLRNEIQGLKKRIQEAKKAGLVDFASNLQTQLYNKENALSENENQIDILNNNLNETMGKIPELKQKALKGFIVSKERAFKRDSLKEKNVIESEFADGKMSKKDYIDSKKANIDDKVNFYKSAVDEFEKNGLNDDAVIFDNMLSSVESIAEGVNQIYNNIDNYEPFKVGSGKVELKNFTDQKTSGAFENKYIQIGNAFREIKFKDLGNGINPLTGNPYTTSEIKEKVKLGKSEPYYLDDKNTPNGKLAILEVVSRDGTIKNVYWDKNKIDKSGYFEPVDTTTETGLNKKSSVLYKLKPTQKYGDAGIVTKMVEGVNKISPNLINNLGKKSDAIRDFFGGKKEKKTTSLDFVNKAISKFFPKEVQASEIVDKAPIYQKNNQFSTKAKYEDKNVKPFTPAISTNQGVKTFEPVSTPKTFTPVISTNQGTKTFTPTQSTNTQQNKSTQQSQQTNQSTQQKSTPTPTPAPTPVYQTPAPKVQYQTPAPKPTPAPAPKQNIVQKAVSYVSNLINKFKWW